MNERDLRKAMLDTPAATPTIHLDEGKYTFFKDREGLQCLRHGMPWRDFVGDKATHALFDFAVETCEKLTAAEYALKTPPIGPMPDERLGAYRLRGAEMRASYWLTGRHHESRAEAVLCVEQAANAWKNAAYHFAEELEKTRAALQALVTDLEQRARMSATEADSDLVLDASDGVYKRALAVLKS